MSGGRGMSFSLSGGRGAGRGGATGGKLSFSLGGGLKRPTPARAAAGVFEAPDSDDEERKTGAKASRGSAEKRHRGEGGSAASDEPQAPTNPEVLKCADKLAAFVAKNGDKFENVTKDRNPGDTPFRFLFDKNGNDYKWYRMKLQEYKGHDEDTGKGAVVPGGGGGAAAARGGAETDASGSLLNTLKGAQSTEEAQRAKAALDKGDSLAAMNAFMRLAAKHEEVRGPVQDPQAMPPPDVLKTDTGREKTFAVYKDDGSRGHHMGDYIPQEQLDKFLAKQGDPAAQARIAAQELANRIGSENKGHQMLAKMGWTEGAGLGASQSGMSAPIEAGGVKQDNLGIGAANTHEVGTSDDIYEAYKKRMMLGYKHRPNPLGNPRKQYY